MLQSKQSEAFLAIAETGSFELAAIQLNITASAVTLRLQTLEKQLGQVLILRERPCRVTPMGKTLLQHLQHIRLMESDLLQNFQGKHQASAFYKLKIATNADSLATWLLAALQQSVQQQNILLDLKIDDQTQTHHLLEAGLVNACISTEKTAMHGCHTHALGKMTYRMVASKAFYQQYFKNDISREVLKNTPAVIFNEKDQLHQQILTQHFGLTQTMFPYHSVPSSTAFAEAILLSFGYGLLPDFQIENRIQNGQLIEIMPFAQIQIPLYWHHWKRQSPQLEALTQHLIQQSKYLFESE